MLCIDHKPLITILGPKKGVPPIVAARLGGLYNQLHIITQSSFVLLRLMPMLTHCHACHLKVFTAKEPLLFFSV